MLGFVIVVAALAALEIAFRLIPNEPPLGYGPDLG